jgi:hypothetical protein
VSRLKIDRVPAPVLLEGDARVQALQAVILEPETPNDYVETIVRLWGRAQSAFLDIGRLLIRAKENLPHGEYMSAVEKRLPFASRTAYQLREAARWALEMDKRRTITLDRLPGSYSTIYLLSTMAPPMLEAAEAEGLLRPELRRSELIAWRKAKGEEQERRPALEARRSKLLKERDRLDEELQRIDAELGFA